MCGIVGMVGQGSVNQEIYDALLLLQHRGQDSTGIATAEANGIFHIAKAKGQVREAFRTRDMRASSETSAWAMCATRPRARHPAKKRRSRST